MEKHKISYSTKIILIVSIFLLLMDGLLGGLLMVRSTHKMKTIVQNKIMEVSLTAASFLDGDEIEALTYYDHDNKTEPYMKAYNTLSLFKTNNVDNNAGLAYIYCLVMNEEGKAVFSVDPSEEPGIFLEEETVQTEALYKAFEGTAGFDDVSYVDRWGDLLSAYAPIFSNKADHHVCAVVAVDVWASWYKNEIASNAIMIGIVTATTIILGVLAAFFITRKMRKRLTVLARDMDELQRDVSSLINDINDQKYLVETTPVEENEKVYQSLAQLREQIDSTKGAVRNYIEYAHQQAYMDALTKLGNRNAYFGVVEQLNEKINNKIYVNFAVLVFDINGLKEINDVHGHEMGDKAIIICGDVLKTLFGEDISFRIGGDELVVIYQNVYEETIKEKMSHIEELIEKGSEEKGLSFKLTVSYGCSFFNATKDKRYEDVFNKADEKMYKQKSLYYETNKPYKRRKL